MKNEIINSIILATMICAIWSLTAGVLSTISITSLSQFFVDITFGQLALHIPALIICFIAYAFKKAFNFTLYNIILCLMGVFLIAGNFLH